MSNKVMFGRGRSLRTLVSTGLAFALMLALAGVAAAMVTGGGTIIPAPANIENSDVLTGAASNLAQEAFNERQGVVLAAPLAVDAGFIAAGTVVDSHMIFLNKPDGVAGVVSDAGRVWTFANPVIGVMSDSTGSLEVLSSPILGAPGTTYPAAPFPARGMESADSYVVAGNTITVTMRVS